MLIAKIKGRSKMKNLRAAIWIMIIAAVFFMSGCSGGGGGTDSTSSITGDTGTLSLKMVDKTTQEYAAVYVTIKEVQVCMETGNSDGVDDDAECEWKTIETLDKTYNLLDLVNGVMATLGQENIETGTYNQMRLLLLETPDGSSNINDDPHPFPQYLIDEDGEAHEMKVPSGYQSGIKLVHQFDIVKDLTTELILDFDVTRSVVKAGNSGKYILKPTIKVTGTHNRAVVSGVVTTDDEALGGTVQLPVVLPQAQINAWRENEAGILEIVTGTQTDDSGGYVLYLDLDRAEDLTLMATDYTLVATKEGYGPECSNVLVLADQTYPGNDFIVSPVDTVIVSGTITGTLDADLDPAPTVTISFRQLDLCLPEAVEAAFTTATDDGDEATTDIFYDSLDGSFQYTYTIDVPLGTYDIVASIEPEGLDDVEFPSYNVSDPTALDIDFITP
jgi:hypothetical protein